MNRIRKILSLKFWVPVLCIGLVVLFVQMPLTQKKAEIKSYSKHAETIPVKKTDWGKVISEGLVVVGSIATTGRALIELVALFKRRKVTAFENESFDAWLDRIERGKEPHGKERRR